jgi:hypothetical protein
VPIAGQDELWIGDGCEVDERSAARRLGGRKRERRLPGAARPGQRDEPHVGSTEQRGHRRKLDVSPDQLGRAYGWALRRRRPLLDRGCSEPRVVVEDPLLQLAELG